MFIININMCKLHYFANCTEKKTWFSSLVSLLFWNLDTESKYYLAIVLSIVPVLLVIIVLLNTHSLLTEMSSTWNFKDSRVSFLIFVISSLPILTLCSGIG